MTAKAPLVCPTKKGTSMAKRRFGRLLVCWLFGVSLLWTSGCKKHHHHDNKGHKHDKHAHKHSKKGHKHGHKHGHKGKHGHKHGLRHDFSNVEKWVKIFNDPKRDLWQKPKQLMTLMKLKPGMTVVDIGAGTGYFLRHLRAAVGANGNVWALDIAQSLVDYMNKQAKKVGWKNVKARKVKENDPQLGKGSVDRILIVNTWHHIGDRPTYAKKLKAALKPGGSLFVVDYTMEAKRGPRKGHRLSPAQVQKELKAAGFLSRLCEEKLPEQYVVVGVRAHTDGKAPKPAQVVCPTPKALKQMVKPTSR